MLQYTSDQIFNNKSKDQKGPATKSPCNDNADTAVVLITDFGIFFMVSMHRFLFRSSVIFSSWAVGLILRAQRSTCNKSIVLV